MAALPLWRKIAYAAGGLGMNLPNLVISQWIFKRWVPSPADALVPVALFSAIFFAGRVTDAVTDPLVAFWSDGLRSKRGRRIPFILWGVVPMALVFFLLWFPPVQERHWLNVVWAIVFIQAYFVLYTVVVTPYLALLPEVTSGAEERVNLTTLQAVFVMLGTVVFAVIGVVIEGAGWLAMGGIVAVLCIVSYVPTLLAIHEEPLPPRDANEPRPGLVSWVRMSFHNRPFLHLLGATSFYWFGLNLLIMIVPYWAQDLLGLDESAVALLMGPFLVANLVFFVVFNWVAKRQGKFVAFVITIVASALAAPLLCAVGHLPFGTLLQQSAFAMGIIGIPTAGFMMLPFALLADVVDHDEELTGQRREAIYFGVQAITQKTMIGASVFAFGLMVLSGGGESASLTGLKAVPLVAASSFVLGLVAFWGYSLRETAQGQSGVISQ